VLIVLVLVFRFVLRRWLSPRWQYALWLLVVARLALPAVPESPTSLFNLSPLRTGTAPAALGWTTAPPASTGAGAPASAVAAPAASRRSWTAFLPPALFAIWAAVALLLLARIALRSYRLTSRVCRQRPVTRQDVADLLEDCKQELGVHIPINVVQSASVQTPALLGFLRPRLLLPDRLIETFDREALRLLFLHELAHVRRRDILVNWVATFVHVIHWFNPLVALAMSRMRADRELATDSLVLSHRGEAENRPYGNTLIRLLEFAAAPSLLPGTVGVLEDKAELTRRVTMIATHSRTAYRWSALAATLLLFLAVTTLTGAPAPVEDTAAVDPAAGLKANEDAIAALHQWVRLVDSGAYPASWDAASAAFRSALKRADWVKALTDTRQPLGALVSRTVVSAERPSSIPAAPDGEYVVVETKAAFENASATVEKATLMREPNGEWRIAGYFIRPDLSSPPAATAQEDTGSAEKALAEWLALVDTQEYGSSWDAASGDFRKAVTRSDWERMVRAARAPLGDVLSRTTQSVTPQGAIPGAPEGRYVIVQTAAAFAHKASATETCTLQQEADGQWRIAGYFIK
jgi:bla regulator protein BlaR1